MAINTTGGALLSPEVFTDVIKQGKTLGISLTANDLLQNSTIERKHDIWELRYRSVDPFFAQTVANVWADIGFQAMLSRQAAREAPDYVIFQPPSYALEPTEPVLYDRNRLVIAGVAIGFIGGTLTTSLISRRSRKATQAPETVA